MCQAFVESQFDRNLTGKAFGECAKSCFHELVTIAQYNQLRREMGDAFGDGQQQVEAFLFRQAADDAKQWAVGRFFQSHFALQGGFVEALGSQFVCCISVRQGRIIGRIPDLGIDTIEDAAQACFAVTQEWCEGVAEVLVLNFPGVGRADG